jgi:hypothetical protein
VNGNAQSDRAKIGAFRGLRSMHRPLDLAGPFYRIKSTGELGKDTVSRRFDDPSAVSLGAGADHIGKQCHPPFMRAGLVLGHQDRIADDIRKCDRG